MYDGEDGNAKYRAATALADVGTQIRLTSQTGFPDFIHPKIIDELPVIDLESDFESCA